MGDTAAVQLGLQPLFRSEYEQELESWLRRRFRTVCVAYLFMGATVFLIRMLGVGFADAPGRWWAISITLLWFGISLAINLYFLFYARHAGGASREQLLRAASTMILTLGAVWLCKAVLVEAVSDEKERFLLPLFFWHFIPCLFLPWTPRESLRPIVPLMIAWMVGVLFIEPDIAVASRILKAVLGPGILIPGLGICALRMQYHSERFRSRMVGKHFLSMRQELVKARTIHESLFPSPHDDGFVRFEYSYAPARELGGDYIHLFVSGDGVVHLTVIDVTGHGLAAALTVNRLFGELERIRGEAPQAHPGEVLSLLNRYIHHTMVRHNIFVTALCVSLDPYLGKLHWANAGHPPAFLRGINGAVKSLPATTVLLGALPPDEFAANERTIELSPGDIVITYTDGAFEGRDRLGERLGLDMLRQMVHSQPPPRNWAQFIASAVEKHTAGRPEDDILVAALTFRAPRTRAKRGEPALAVS